MSKIEPRQHAFDPDFTCSRCARLVQFRVEAEKHCPGGFNLAVPSYGDLDAWLLIVGLAPGMHGANRTGRPFTGDQSGALLFKTLGKFNLAQGTYSSHALTELALDGVLITNAVRCLPPENKPLLEEVYNCAPYLSAAIAQLSQLKVILCLGKVAHDATVRALGQRLSKAPFGHAAMHSFGQYILLDSYHCSRYNVNTKRLTESMFEAVFAKAIALAGRAHKTA
ncbi:MAG: uracil-DNA glycosylase [Pseudomonadota bacterium]